MDSVQKARSALHGSFEFSRIVGREREREDVSEFLREHYYARDRVKGSSGIPSLYLSGIPGTGKTALVRDILKLTANEVSEPMPPSKRRSGRPRVHTLNNAGKFQEPFFINCMSLNDSKSVYGTIFQALTQRKLLKPPKQGTAVTVKDIKNTLERFFTEPSASEDKVLVVLDEIDSLLSSSQSQETLYRLFEWPSMANSRLVLIGIANALDLTERFLPRLKARGCEPLHVNFSPYSVSEIASIIKDRLAYSVPPDKENSSGSPLVFMSSAIEMAARKVEGTGDIRKALDVCRMALDLAEKMRCDKNSTGPLHVTVSHIIKATARSLDSAGAGKLSNKWQPLSVSAKALLVTSLALIHAKSSLAGQRLPVDKLYSCYSKMLTKPDIRRIGVFSAMTRSEMIDLVTLLENQGLMTLTSGVAPKTHSALGGGTFGAHANLFKRRKLAGACTNSNNFSMTDFVWTKAITLNFHRDDLISVLHAQADLISRELPSGEVGFNEARAFLEGLTLSTRLFANRSS